jgi:hypothetical protein
MGEANQAFEKWVWLEPIGFDNTQPDYGVAQYVDTAGFTPDAISLLMTSPDFVLQHPGMAEEVALPTDICSREGHEHNQDRKRQVWTNHQVRGLVVALRERGVAVYLSFFTAFNDNKFHREWVTDHPEVRAVFSHVGRSYNVNSLARFQDGSYYEDFLLARLVEAMKDYGFDGWHAADGYGPLGGALYQVDCSDDMVGQFVKAGATGLPESVTQSCDDDVEKLGERARWLWRNRRRAWIEFYVDRWARFWQKAVDALHAEGKKAVINSAWGRAPFESLYRYGIDYRKIADTGVDGILVETVAAGLSMDPRAGDETRHYDFLSMLMLIKAYVPDTKLIFLHNAQDIVEQWDTLRHAPTVMEKEIFSLTSVYHIRAEGGPARCADALLVCLGDGIHGEEWRWLRDRWDRALRVQPRRVLGATLVWSDAAVENQIDEFTNTRCWTVHRTLFRLMTRGAPVQAVVNVSDLESVQGAVLVINPHLFTEAEREKAFGYRNGPIVAVGPDMATLPEPGFAFEDVYPPRQLRCWVYGAEVEPNVELHRDGGEELPEDVMAVAEPTGYWDHFSFRKVSESFLDACARLILQCSSPVSFVSGAESVTHMLMEIDAGRLRLALKSKAAVYVSPEIDMGEEVAAVAVVSPFPLMPVIPDGSRFRVKVPPNGVVVLDISLA